MSAKRTLLDMVQSIMSDMDSDSVETLDETVEAMQVASVIRDVYEQLVTDQKIPEKQQLIKLDDIDLDDYPGALNYFAIPARVAKLYWLKYNVKLTDDVADNFIDLEYLEPKDFMQMVMRNQEGTGMAEVTDPYSGVVYYVPNEVHPRFYTSLEDNFIAVDAFLQSIEPDGVLGAKTITMSQIVPEWTMEDDFVPDLDDNMFPYLLAEAKSTCFVNLKQQANTKIEKQARDQRVRLQNHKFRTEGAQKASTGSTGPNYGRN